MTDYKQEIEDLLQDYLEGVIHYCGQNDCSHQQSYNELTTALTHLIETEKIAELRLIEKAQQDYDEWSGFCMDDTSDFGNYITQRISELQSRGEV